MRRIVAWVLAASLALAACSGSGSATPTPGASAVAPAANAESGSTTSSLADEPIRLVTLGDGYTYGTGTSTPARDSWPAQLAESMKRRDVSLRVWNLAEQSHTSDLVVEEQLGQVASLEPDVVTVLVGVNDIITGDTGYYRQNLETIFDELVSVVPADHVFAITIPDHTLTGWARSFGPVDAGRAAVEALNATLAEVAAERGVGIIDISSVNDLVASDPGLVVEDGPYGSPKQYAGWVEIIGPRILAAISGAAP